MKTTKDFINKDQYWMGLAFFMSAGSKSSDPQATIIVDQNYELVLGACNSSAKNVSGHYVHSEINVLTRIQSSQKNYTAYLTHTPCYHCVVSLVANGIERIIYFPTNDLDSRCHDAVRGIASLFEFRGNLNWMRDYLADLKDQGIFEISPLNE